MAVMSTVFEETCEFINGVGSCTTIIGSRQGGPRLDTPTAAPLLTTPLSPTSTSTSPTSYPTSKPVSPSSTRSPPSLTPLSTRATAAAVAISNSPITDSLPPSLRNASSPPVTSNTGITNSISTITSGSDSTTVTPNTRSRNTDTLAADSLSPTSSTSSPNLSTSTVPFQPISSSSTSRLPAGSIAAIAISIGGILLVLVLGLVWYAARRRRQAPTVVVSSISLGSNSDANLAEATLTSTTRHALLSVDGESEKLEYSPRSSLSDTRGSTVIQALNFMPLPRSCDHSPLFRFLETVAFLTAPSVPVKGSRGAQSVSTAMTTAPSPSDRGTEAIKAPEESAAEMEGGTRRHSDLWEGDGYQDGEAGSRSGVIGSFRYETDAGIRLDGGPPGQLQYADDDQRTIATVITLPPPYSQY